MRDGMKAVVVTVGLVALAVLLVVGATWLYQQFEGGLLSQHFQNVKHSQQYVESTNQAIRTLMTDYESPTATEGQKKADLNQIYALAGSMDPSEVASDVQTWLKAHPNTP